MAMGHILSNSTAYSLAHLCADQQLIAVVFRAPLLRPDGTATAATAPAFPAASVPAVPATTATAETPPAVTRFVFFVSVLLDTGIRFAGLDTGVPALNHVIVYIVFALLSFQAHTISHGGNVIEKVVFFFLLIAESWHFRFAFPELVVPASWLDATDYNRVSGNGKHR
jgi:hypothetical protein